MVEGTWPMELITDDARQPLAVSTATDFAMRVLLSDHLEDVVVFRGGGDALGLPTSACLPGWLLVRHRRDCADGVCARCALLRPVGPTSPPLGPTLANPLPHLA